MSNGPQTSAFSGPRIALLMLLFAGFTFAAIVALPPRSRATRGLPQMKSTEGKRSKGQFVPGHVLVRYKDEATAKRQQRTTTALSVEERSIPIRFEALGNGGEVSGLRL